ncbi:hypothetical protein ACFUGD_01910 [Streptomyces sp. NPDC057217]|uniref:hypothetical protein n=1 Tax=Streptomyces sp. NPDC057217 TaxID=3346054 RepID=UPI003628CBFB
MTQPEPAQPRHTADTITDDTLTALYDERDELRLLLHDAEGDRDSWARDARLAEQQAEADARKAHTDLIDEQKRGTRVEAERDAARNTLADAQVAARRLSSALIAVAPLLDKPYPDDPRWTPWTRFVAPALRNLRTALDRRQTQETT